MNDKILVLNGPNYAEAVKGLGEICLNKQNFLENPKQYKLVMFTGGEDVDPALYSHTSPKGMCHYNSNRDMNEMEVFQVALKNNIKMTGICRGSQFLNVMSGGTMVHHITNHGVNHTMVCGDTGKTINVTSTHHQMSIPAKDGFVVAWSSDKRSTCYLGDEDEEFGYDDLEVEAICYPKNNIFAVQYHPEYMDGMSNGYLWYKQAVKDLLEMNMEDFIRNYTYTSGNNTFEAASLNY